MGVEKFNQKKSILYLDIPDWANVRFVGRSLKRMNLIKEKRRIATGIEVMLSFQKIRDKARIYGIGEVKR